MAFSSSDFDDMDSAADNAPEPTGDYAIQNAPSTNKNKSKFSNSDFDELNKYAANNNKNSSSNPSSSFLRSLANNPVIDSINNTGGGIANGILNGVGKAENGLINTGTHLWDYARGVPYKNNGNVIADAPQPPFSNPNSSSYKLSNDVGDFIGGSFPFAVAGGPLAKIGSTLADVSGATGAISRYGIGLLPRVAGNAAIGAAVSPDNAGQSAILNALFTPVGDALGGVIDKIKSTNTPDLVGHIKSTLSAKSDVGLKQMRDIVKQGAINDAAVPPIDPNIDAEGIVSKLTGGQNLQDAIENNDKKMGSIVLTNGKGNKSTSTSNYNNILNGADSLGIGNNVPLDTPTMNSLSRLDPTKLTKSTEGLNTTLSSQNGQTALGQPQSNASLRGLHSFQSSLGEDARNYNTSIVKSDRPLSVPINEARQLVRNNIITQLQGTPLEGSYERATDYHKNNVLPYESQFPKVMMNGDTNPPNIVNKFKNPEALEEEGSEKEGNQEEIKEPQGPTSAPNRPQSLSLIRQEGGDDLTKAILLDRLRPAIDTNGNIDDKKLISQVSKSGNFKGFEPYLNGTGPGKELKSDIIGLSNNISAKHAQDELAKNLNAIDQMPAKQLAANLPGGMAITPEMGAAVSHDYLRNSLQNFKNDPYAIGEAFKQMNAAGHAKYADASGLAPVISTLKNRLGFQDTAGRIAETAMGATAGHAIDKLFGGSLGYHIGPSLGAFAGYKTTNYLSPKLNNLGNILPGKTLRGIAGSAGRGALSNYLNYIGQKNNGN